MNEGRAFIGNSYWSGWDDGLVWTLLHPNATPDHLGWIPLFLRSSDERSAVDQINDRYARHTGGATWSPTRQAALTMEADGLHYPGDPVMVVIAETKLRDETIRFYDRSWMSIQQPDGSYEIARMD